MGNGKVISVINFEWRNNTEFEIQKGTDKNTTRGIKKGRWGYRSWTNKELSLLQVPANERQLRNSVAIAAKVISHLSFVKAVIE